MKTNMEVKRQSRFVLVQTKQEGDPEVNLKVAREAVAKASKLYQPDLMVFPELFMSDYPMGTDRSICLGSAQTLDGPFVTGMQKLAAEYKVWLVFGMNEKVEDPKDDRNYNCTCMIDSDGKLVAHYHKTHLYDAFSFKESNNNKPGDALFEPIDTPFGRIGLFVCYEVRFPEVARYQRKKGADIIIMPTAWVKGDLKSLQFRTLITARAIENTVYLVACDQCQVDSMGESVVVDPMGVAVASAGEVPTMLCATIDLDRIEEVRKKLPAYKDRRPELYEI
jgi:predicted amidohydrolase